MARSRTTRGAAATLAAATAALLAVTAAGQGAPPEAYGVIDRLPARPAFAAPPVGPSAAVGSSPTLGPIRLAQNSEFANEAATPATPPATATATGGVPGRGVLQGIELVGDWSPRLDRLDGLGWSQLGATLKLGVPPQVLGFPLLVSPRAGLTLVDGPGGLDLPPRLYDLELGFRTFRPINDRWRAMASVNVGLYGDDDSLDSSDALRVSGALVGLYQASPEWQWAFGVAFLNRDDIPFVPAVGVVVDRGPVKYELILPRPRIIWRRSTTPDEVRDFYVGGEFGGGAWAIERSPGVTDTLNLSRFGVLAGYEAGARLGWRRRIEFGYLFGQEIELGDSGETLDLDDSLVARVGWTY